MAAITPAVPRTAGPARPRLAPDDPPLTAAEKKAIGQMVVAGVVMLVGVVLLGLFQVGAEPAWAKIWVLSGGLALLLGGVFFGGLSWLQRRAAAGEAAAAPADA